MSEYRDETEAAIKQNKRIWEETGRQSEKYKIPKVCVIDNITDFIETKLPEFVSQFDSSKRVMVFNNTLLDVAKVAFEKHLNPMVINAGCENDPIKILETGAIGTEWDLFRRTNLARGITVEDHYPLRDGKALYSNDVTVYKASDFKLTKPFVISVLTIPPLRRPGLVSSRNSADVLVEMYQNQTEEERMRTAINKMFEVALYKGHQCLIIDDFGCQKSCENPIGSVIKMFNDAIQKYPIQYVFFAISEPVIEAIHKKNRKTSTEYKNYTIFNENIYRPV